MKKFLSMALAVLMAYNFTFLGSGNVAAAMPEDEQHYNNLDSDDDYSEEEEYYDSNLDSDDNYNKEYYDFNIALDNYSCDFNENSPKEEKKGNKLSKVWTVVKVFSLAACIAFLGYIVIYLTTNPALSNNPKVKKLVEEIKIFLSKMKGIVSGYNIKNPKVKEVIEKINNLLSETKDTVSGYYIIDQMNKFYENVCPASKTNGAWDCLLKSLRLRGAAAAQEKGNNDDTCPADEICIDVKDTCPADKICIDGYKFKDSNCVK